MINGIPESSKFDDVKIPEVGRQMEQTDQRPVPSLEDLKNKLEDIFKVETLDDASTKENITETNPLDESNLCSVTLDDGTVVTVPDVKSYEIVTKADDNGTVYLKNGELEPCKNRHPSPICTRFEHHLAGVLAPLSRTEATKPYNWFSTAKL